VMRMAEKTRIALGKDASSCSRCDGHRRLRDG